MPKEEKKLSDKEEALVDEVAELLEDEELLAHPFTDFDAVEHRKKTVNRLTQQYQSAGLNFKVTEQGVVVKLVARGLPDLVKTQIRKDHSGLSEEQLAQSFDQLVDEIPRFDWRSLGVTPFVRLQDSETCWASAATAAFESSLMIQRAKAGLTKQQGANITTAMTEGVEGHVEVQNIPVRRTSAGGKVSVDVNSTIDFVKGQIGETKVIPDWHQNAFRYFLKYGAPLVGMKIFAEAEKVDSDFSPMRMFYKNEDGTITRVKAIAWDYVHDPEKQRPDEVPPEKDLKIALLEHGPLVVGIVPKGEFPAWGKLVPGKTPPVVPLAEDGFPLDTAPVFHGNFTSDTPAHVMLLLGWDEPKHAWIVQNSHGTDWGYQCDGPRVMNDSFRSTDRGFAYIGYGSNQIGTFATWIEAELLTMDQEDKMHQSVIDAIQATVEQGRQLTFAANQVVHASTDAASGLIMKAVHLVIGMMQRVITGRFSGFLKPGK